MNLGPSELSQNDTHATGFAKRKCQRNIEYCQKGKRKKDRVAAILILRKKNSKIF